MTRGVSAGRRSHKPSPHSARLDSGAEAILLRESTVEANNLQVSTGDPTKIILSNGQSTDTHETANIGEIKALVCPDKDLTEDLVSINPLLDHGFNLPIWRRTKRKAL